MDVADIPDLTDEQVAEILRHLPGTSNSDFNAVWFKKGTESAVALTLAYLRQRYGN